MTDSKKLFVGLLPAFYWDNSVPVDLGRAVYFSGWHPTRDSYHVMGQLVFLYWPYSNTPVKHEQLYSAIKPIPLSLTPEELTKQKLASLLAAATVFVNHLQPIVGKVGRVLHPIDLVPLRDAVADLARESRKPTVT